MKFAAPAIRALAAVPRATDTVSGFDVSHYQPNVDFSSAYSDDARFVIMKVCTVVASLRHKPLSLSTLQTNFGPQATESTNVVDSAFASHWTDATNAGLIRGAYHFGHPDASTGADQAGFFTANGGSWTDDGQTLPGMLDLEAGPSACWNMSSSAMVSWISDFVDTYHSSQGIYPMIYTSTNWWTDCTANSAEFASCPLVIAEYSSEVGTLPAGWEAYTIWQYNGKSSWGGASDRFNGDITQLQTLAASG